MSSIVKKSTGLSALKSAIATDSRVSSGEVARAIASEVLIMAIDCSGSMMDVARAGESATKSQAARDAAIALLNVCGPGSVVGAVAFSDRVLETIEPGTIRARVDERLRYFPKYDGGTIFVDALKASFEAIKKAGEKKVRRIILMTDGLDYPEFRDNLMDFLKVLKTNKVIVDCVAFGGDADRALLQKIADETGGVLKEAKDAASLTKAFLQLEAGIRGLLAAK